MHTGLIGTTFAGRFRIVRKLGEGGQSEVYVAVQEALGREIALKVIRADLATDASQIERFKREAQHIAELSHPHIVTIFDTGVDNGNFYMAMELLKGESLRERIDRSLVEKTPIGVDEATAIIKDTLTALQAAHAKGVVHRDLKPENIFLVDAAGRKDFVKVLDFGIARKRDDATTPQTGPQVTAQGMIVGTPGYIAPEVLMGKGAADDPRVDLYAMGVIWWELLAGRPLFEGVTPVSIVMKHASEQPSPLGLVGRVVPPPIEQLIMLLLEKDAVLRPTDAASTLERVMRAEKASAPQPVSGVVAAPATPAAASSASSLSSAAPNALAPAPVGHSFAGNSGPPPGLPEQPKKRSALAGCLMVGCGVFVLGGLVTAILAVAGVIHLVQPPVPVPVTRPPVPVVAPVTTPVTTPPPVATTKPPPPPPPVVTKPPPPVVTKPPPPPKKPPPKGTPPPKDRKKPRR